MPFKEFPWFEHATIKDVLDVQLEGDDHLHWPALDVDLTLEMLAHPERYPLVAQR